MDSKENFYITWVYDKVQGDEICSDIDYLDQYDLVYIMYVLDRIEFKYTIPNDDNRAADGLALRKEYYESLGVDNSNAKECSVLEMMVALAIRIEKDIMGDVNNDVDRTSLWFWSMLENLDIVTSNDNKIMENVQNMVDRKYDQNGKGGLFPLKGDGFGDQRKTEIWYQLAYWIQENYPDSEDDPDDF